MSVSARLDTLGPRRGDDGYLNAADAAAYVGYKPGTRFNRRRQDMELRAFYAFVDRHQVVTKHRGRRLLFSKPDLDRAVDASTEQHEGRIAAMEELGRRHARGELRAVR